MEEEWEEVNSGAESDCSVSEEFASSRASRKAARGRGRGSRGGGRGSRGGRSTNPSGQKGRGRGRGRGRVGVREPVPRDQDRQNVTNWNFMEYVSSPEQMMPLAPVREEGEKRKAGRPLGSSNKKKYTSSARRAIEEATLLLEGETFVDEEKDFENESEDEGEVNDNPDEPEDILVYVSEGEEEQQEEGSGNVRAGVGAGRVEMGGGEDPYMYTRTRGGNVTDTAKQDFPDYGFDIKDFTVAKETAVCKLLRTEAELFM